MSATAQVVSATVKAVALKVTGGAMFIPASITFTGTVTEVASAGDPMWFKVFVAVFAPLVTSLVAFAMFYFFQRKSDGERFEAQKISDDKRFALERERFQLEQNRWRAEHLLDRKVDQIEKVNKAMRVMVYNTGYAYRVINDMDKKNILDSDEKDVVKKKAKEATDEFSVVMAEASLYLKPEVTEQVRKVWQEVVMFYIWALPTRNETNSGEALVSITREAERCYQVFRDEVQSGATI